MPTNPQNTIIPPAIQYYNSFRKVHTHHLRSLELIDPVGNKFTLPSNQEQIRKFLLDYIYVDILISQTSRQKPTPTDISHPISINKTSFTTITPIDRTLIHRRLMHTGHTTIDLMCKDSTMLDLPQKLPIHHPDTCPCIICWTAKSNTPPKNKQSDLTYAHPGGLLHLDFTFYNVISIRGFTSELNIIDAATRKLWTFVTSDKRPPLKIMKFFLSYLSKINRVCHEIRVDEGGELGKSSEFTDLLIDSTINLQSTGGYASWLNGTIERSHQTTAKMVRAALRDSKHSPDKWCYALEASVDVYNGLRHSKTKEQPHFQWYNSRTSIHDYRVWGCEIYPRSHNPKKLDDRVEKGYFMGYTTTRSIIKWWDPISNNVYFCTSAKFVEHDYKSPDGSTAPGCLLQQNKRLLRNTIPTISIDISNHPLFDSTPIELSINLPPKGHSLGIELLYCDYNNMSYIYKSLPNQPFWTQLPSTLRHNVWILSIDTKQPITKEQVISDFRSLQTSSTTNIKLILAKRTAPTRTNYEKNRALFHKIRFVLMDDKNPIILPVPIAKKVIMLPYKPSTPEHIGEMIKDPLRAEWTDSVFENYEKMWITGTFSKTFLRSTIPSDTKIICPRLAFKVKLTELTDQYDLYCRR